MRRKVRHFILTIAIVPSVIDWAAEEVRTTPNQLKPGEYLSVPFLRSLEHVASPSGAHTGPGAYFARVQKGPSGGLDLTIGTFHDGWAEVQFKSDGLVTFVYPKDGSITVTPLSQEQFSVVTHDPDAQVTFKYVESYDALVTQLFLIGAYVNRDGRRYVFSGNGQADFAGQTLPYALDPGDDDDLDRVKV